MRPQPAIDALRAQIEKIEGPRRRAQSVLPFR
ncbi:damage-inducible protein, partial [Mesorhizobium sp. M5C.F.Ca.IN.020.32.2.1]